MNDAELFIKLDEYSDKFRGAACDLSDVIEKLCMKTYGTVNDLCHTLKELQVTPIENICDLLLGLNEKVQLATIELNKAALETIPQSENNFNLMLEEYLNKADIFTAEAINFAKFANNLNNSRDEI